MPIRTDLAMETIDEASGRLPNGVTRKIIRQNGREIHMLRVETEEAAIKINKPIGEYATVQTTDFRGSAVDFCSEIDAIAAILTMYLPKSCKSVLVVGLGNRDITPDALGPLAIESIFVTRHVDDALQKEIGLEGLCGVAAIAPGVLGQTGVESAEIISALVKKLSPDCVLIIDALAAKSVDRLATTVQISTAGISPGSGVQNRRKELTNATLGVPVIAIGVPTVVDMATIATDLLGFDDREENNANVLSERARTMMVTPREIDLAVGHAAKTIALSINKALQPGLTLDEITALVS